MAAIAARYEGLIAEIHDNQSMSQAQKAAAIVGLRHQQAKETSGAAKAIAQQASWGAGMPSRGTMRKKQSAGHDEGDAAPPCDNQRPEPESGGATPGAMRAQFRAAFREATQRAENPQPKPRRSRGETDKGHVPAPRRMLRSGAAARGRYAALRPVAAPADAHARASLYLADTLEWLNLWEDNADNDCWHEEEFNAKQEHYSFQP